MDIPEKNFKSRWCHLQSYVAGLVLFYYFLELIAAAPIL